MLAESLYFLMCISAGASTSRLAVTRSPNRLCTSQDKVSGSGRSWEARISAALVFEVSVTAAWNSGPLQVLDAAVSCLTGARLFERYVRGLPHATHVL